MAVVIGGVKLSLVTLLLVVAMAIYILAVIFTDTPFEQYIKHFILSKKAEKYGSNLEGTRLIKQLIANKNSIVAKEWATWRDLKASYAEYLNMSYFSKITEYYPSEMIATQNKGSKLFPIISTITPLGEITVEMPCFTFSANNCLEMFIIYYHQGKFVGINRCTEKETGNKTIPLSTTHSDTSWGKIDLIKSESSYRLKVMIRGNFYKTLLLTGNHTNLVENKFFLCCKITQDTLHRKIAEGEIKNCIPYGNKYLVNRIIPVDAGDKLKIKILQFKSYFDYADRQDKLVLSLEELKLKIIK